MEKMGSAKKGAVGLGLVSQLQQF